MSGTLWLEAEGIQGQYNALESVVGPIFEDESVDSGTVYGNQTYVDSTYVLLTRGMVLR